MSDETTYLTEPLVCIQGSVTMTAQMLEQAQEAESLHKQLEWIATHPDEATQEQRAWLDRVLKAIDEREDEW